MARMQDVVIVGAGPTGLALAAELQRLGTGALVLDQMPTGQNTSRATVVHARTLEVLEPLELAQDLIRRGLPLRDARLREGEKVLATISFDDLPTAYPYMLVCTQDQTEAALTKRLYALGGGVTRPVKVTEVEPDADGVEITYTAAGVLVQNLRARWVVGCDGLHSAVREQAGISFEGGSYDENFVLADVEMDWPLGRDALELFLSDGGLTMIVALPQNRFRIIATVKEAPEHPSMEDCQRILDERTIPGSHVNRVVWSSRFHIQHRVAGKLRAGRMLIAGDAAHVHSPAGGQGMNTGIQDAVALAGALHQALKTGDESGLAEWEKKRLEIAHSVVNTTDTMTRLAASSSTAVHVLRDAVLGIIGHVPALQKTIARRLSEIDNR
jgi:2-polyprenyl-6-methoxyphenol hydroxylase-like FAD-dependent oxidoreductase